MRSLFAILASAAIGFATARMVRPPAEAPAPERPVVAVKDEPTVGFPPPPADWAALPPIERLNKGLAEEDIALAAHRAVEAINAMSAADFQEAFTRGTPISFPKFDSDFRDALERTFFARWLEVDEAGLLAGLARLLKSERFAGILAEFRPDAVLKAAIAAERDLCVREVFTTLARKDLRLARARLAECPAGTMKQEAKRAIDLVTAEVDPIQGMVLVGQADRNPDEADLIAWHALYSAGKFGDGMVFEVLQKLRERLRGNVKFAAYILKHPNAPWETMEKPSEESSASDFSLEALGVAMLLPPEKRQKVLERVLSLPAWARLNAKVPLVAAWAAESPREAAAWVERHAVVLPDATTASAMDVVFYEWRNTDPVAARMWAESIPPGPARDSLVSTMRDDPENDSPAELQRHLHAIAQEKDPQPQRHLSQWLKRDAAAAAEWTDGLPEGLAKDRARGVIAGHVAPKAPDAALEWVESIANEDERLKAAEETLGRIPNSARREWIESLRGVSPLWKNYRQLYR